MMVTITIYSSCSQHMRELEENEGSNLNHLQELEFPEWFQKKVDNLLLGSPEATDELYVLASQSDFRAYSYPGCVVNGVKFLAHSRDVRRKTQNSGVCVSGIEDNTFYGVLEEVLELSYIKGCSVILFRCKWFDTKPKKKRIQRSKNNITSVCIDAEWYKNDPFILASQAQQMFYVDDILNGPRWKFVKHFRHRNIWDIPKPNTNDGDVVTNNFEVLQDDNSSSFCLVVNLPELDTFLYNCNDAQPQVVENEENIFKIVKHDDTFIDDDIEPNDTLEEYKMTNLWRKFMNLFLKLVVMSWKKLIVITMTKYNVTLFVSKIYIIKSTVTIY
ncbi:LOW QUALITY PROTEIN: hypothetical protein TorRG33x02_130790 [Trema orientale]|uniref:DUF4216 domain-containing protein n=1 Tax=Trema orientale TaxID=63057 RepID=A0A2P5EZT7_TREOI|nr:LOW QUALITY PROTEIN: hypothetical protein TorRG33x02_130790 [Trema orientale]